MTGPELHTILHTWSQAGAGFYLEGARVTHTSLPSGEERLPMLPVVVVNGVGVCAAHVGCLLPRGEAR